MQYVNVYKTRRCYGGPEEGGWWYRAGELVECLGPMPRAEAEAIAKDIRNGDRCKVKSEYLTGYNSTDGCDPDGEPNDDYIMVGGAWGYSELQVLVRTEKGREFYPAERPRYE